MGWQSLFQEQIEETNVNELWKLLTGGEQLFDDEDDQLAGELRKLCNEDGSEIDPSKTAFVLHRIGKHYFRWSEYCKLLDEEVWSEYKESFAEESLEEEELKAMHSLLNESSCDEHICTAQRNEMFSLIRSATLYNAAICRLQEDSDDIKQDLEELCSYILKRSGAENQQADLIEQAMKTMKSVEEMRAFAKDQLLRIPTVEKNLSQHETKKLEKKKVSTVRNLQDQISDKYLNIMKDLADYCLYVMGSAPCRFAIVGMGSLARKEITPYSDFEHVIVLEDGSDLLENYNEILNYFRWYSVVFQTIVINMQETIIPSVGIYSLNNKSSKLGDWFCDAHTPRGISFDGLMPHASKCPLGRQETENKPWKTELIKPVSKMLDYLSSEQSLKNGYNLSNILTEICYVYGEQSVYKRFEEGVHISLQNQNDEEMKREIKVQTMKDLKNFGTKLSYFDENLEKKFNMKKVIYRSTTIFVAALGRIKNIHASSCFDVIENLKELKDISDYASDKLMYATALACEVRLKWYITKKKQKDLFDSGKGGLLDIMSDLVGESSAISYFQITYALHCDVSKRFDLEGIHFHANPELLNTSFYYSNKVHTSKVLQYHNNSFELKKHLGFDECLLMLEQEALSNQTNTLLADNKFERKKLQKMFMEMEKVETRRHICSMYFNCGLYDDALKSSEKNIDLLKELRQGYEEVDKKYPNFLSLIELNKLTAEIFHTTAECYRHSGREETAMEYFNEALKLFKETSPNEDNDSDVGMALGEIGESLTRLNKQDEAVVYFRKAKQILSKTAAISIKHQKLFVNLLRNAAICLSKLNKSEEAMDMLEQALHITTKLSSNVDEDRDVGLTLFSNGRCLMETKNYNKAIGYFKDSLKIYEESSTDTETDENISVILQNWGDCLKQTENYQEAVEIFQKAIKIYTRISEHQDQSTVLFFKIGDCMLSMERHHDAVEYFEKALNCLTLTDSSSLDRGWGVVLRQKLGDSLCTLGKPREAITHYRKALEVSEEFKSSITKVTNLIDDDDWELTDLPNYDFKLALLTLAVDHSYSHHVSGSARIAEILKQLGKCLYNIERYDDAITHLKKSLQIYETELHDQEPDNNIGFLLLRVGLCFFKKDHFEIALTYLDRGYIILTPNVSFTNGHGNVAQCALFLGKCYMKFKKFEVAINFFQQCLVEFESNFLFQTQSYVPEINLQLGISYLSLNQLSEADTYLQKAFDMFEHLSLTEESKSLVDADDLGSDVMDIHAWLYNYQQPLSFKFIEKLYYMIENYFFNARPNTRAHKVGELIRNFMQL